MELENEEAVQEQSESLSKDEISLFRPSLPPVPTQSTELGARFKKTVSSILAEKGDMHEKTEPPSAFCRNMISAINAVVSHNGKIPYTHRSDSVCAIEAKPDPDTLVPYVASFTCNVQRWYSYQGNSTYLTQAKILHLEFLVNDEVVSLWRSLICPDSILSKVLLDSLLEIGFSESTLLTWVEAAKNRIKNPFPDFAGDVQLLMYRRGTGEYISVSPVYSTGLGREIRERARNPEWNDLVQDVTLAEKDGLDEGERVNLREASLSNKRFFWIEMGDFRVGGTKPQNAGDYANSVGGRIKYLLAIPPPRNQKLSRLMGRKTLLGWVYDDELVPRVCLDHTTDGEAWVKSSSMVGRNISKFVAETFREALMAFGSLTVEERNVLMSSFSDELEKKYFLGEELPDLQIEQLSSRIAARQLRRILKIRISGQERLSGTTFLRESLAEEWFSALKE